MTSNKDMPAMPSGVLRDVHNAGQEPLNTGLTKREQFCLTMGVAETGDEGLDAIIRKGNEQKFAGLAMQGMLANQYVNDFAREINDDSYDMPNGLGNKQCPCKSGKKFKKCHGANGYE
jgi:uncharacterized protein YecA (UPF0149 family)